MFSCAETETKERRFDVEFRDPGIGRLIVSRVREDVRRSDPSFQKALDQLIIDVVMPEEDGSDRGLRITARTFHEYWDRRGRTRRQHDVSEEVRAAAQALLEACGSAGEEAG